MLVGYSVRRRRAEKSPCRRTRFLRLAFAEFEAAGRWPKSDFLQDHFEKKGLEFDMSWDGRRLPSHLGHMDDELVLTVRGLDRVIPAQGLLDEYIRTVHRAAESFRTDANPTLSLDDLTGKLKLSQRHAECVMSLLESESLIDRRPDHMSEAKILPRIAAYAGARNIGEYIAVQKRASRKRRMRRLRSWPARAAGRTAGDRSTFLENVVVGVLVFVLCSAITVLVSLVFQTTPWSAGQGETPRERQHGPTLGPSKPAPAPPKASASVS
jgi:hypothetical protein